MGLDRGVRHRFWGHPSSAQGTPLPSRPFSSLFSLAAKPWASRDSHQKMALLGRALVSWISPDLHMKVPRKMSDPGSSACPPQFLLCPQEPLCFCSRGIGSQWKQGPRARQGDKHPGRAGRNVWASLGHLAGVTHRWPPPAAPCPRGCTQTGSPWS